MLTFVGDSNTQMKNIMCYLEIYYNMCFMILGSQRPGILLTLRFN